MNLKQRVDSLIKLGKMLNDLNGQAIIEVIEKAQIANPWFTVSNIKLALQAVRDAFLTEESLQIMVTKYHLDDQIQQKNIGLILAGNIPLVGFHDVLCCYLTGHRSIIKLSDKDSVLIQYMIDQIIAIHPDAMQYFVFVEKLKDYDAAIATGSNSTAKHFAYYFKDIPHIIRQNRNSIAVIRGDESMEDLYKLAADVFSYFGLGCRNVSKFFVPKGYDITKLFDAFIPYNDTIHHNKYKNNYDYNVALNLLNKEPFLQNDLIILKESPAIISRIGSLHYEYYTDINELAKWINNNQNDIQCVVSQQPIPNVEIVAFGNTQCPSIDTYADGVDTMQFLLAL